MNVLMMCLAVLVATAWCLAVAWLCGWLSAKGKMKAIEDHAARRKGAADETQA